MPAGGERRGAARGAQGRGRAPPRSLRVPRSAVAVRLAGRISGPPPGMPPSSAARGCWSAVGFMMSARVRKVRFPESEAIAWMGRSTDFSDGANVQMFRSLHSVTQPLCPGHTAVTLQCLSIGGSKRTPAEGDRHVPKSQDADPRCHHPCHNRSLYRLDGHRRHAPFPLERWTRQVFA
jgi:hypothetical protein